MIKLNVTTLRVGFEVTITVGDSVVRRQNFTNKSELEFFIMGFSTCQSVVNDLVKFESED